MRAVIRRNKQLVCDEIAELQPEAGQVLVKTLACGICGSDLHALHHMEHMIELGRRGGGLDNGFDPAADTVFGHEFCAEILDHGPGSSKALKAGTRIVSVPATITATGMELLGFSNRLPGGFAERMLLSEALILEVPNGLSTEHAAMTEPFAVGAHAVAKARMDKDSVALVVGCGPVGLAVIGALKAQGHGPVIAADFSPRRRAAAERLGGDIVLDPAVESPHDRWEALGVPKARGAQQMMRMMGQTFGRPVIFECVGAPGVLQSLIEAAPAGAADRGGRRLHGDRPDRALHRHHQGDRADLRLRLFARGVRRHPLHQLAEGAIDVSRPGHRAGSVWTAWRRRSGTSAIPRPT